MHLQPKAPPPEDSVGMTGTAGTVSGMPTALTETAGTVGTGITKFTSWNLIGMPTTPHTLADVLGPVGTDEFLKQDLGKQFRHFPGSAGKFAPLLTWPDLNQILSLHQLDAPRIRLARDGQPIPSDSFIYYHPSRRPNSPP